MTATRRALAALACAALAAVLVPLASGPAAAAPSGRILIGDSISGMNESALKARGFKVDYTVSRQFYSAPSVVRGYGDRLPANVVISLGANGNITPSDCRQVVRIAGPDRTVFFVTNRVPRSWESTNNSILHKCVGRFASDRARIIDWWALSDRHDAWFYSDGYHPRELTGAIEYAKLIDGAVDLYGR